MRIYISRIRGGGIRIIFRNNLDSRVTLPSPSPWEIIGLDGKRIYSPVTVEKVTAIDPGGSLEWRWDLRDEKGEIVRGGDYVLKFRVLDPDELIYVPFRV